MDPRAARDKHAMSQPMRDVWEEYVGLMLRVAPHAIINWAL